MNSEISVNKLETLTLSKIYFLGLIDDGQKKIEIISDIIKKTEEAASGLEKMEARFSSLNLPDEVMDVARFQAKTLDYGVMAHAAGKKWLYELLEELKNEE